MKESTAQTHWQRVYSEKAPTDVSWYQAVPTQSLALIGAGTSMRVVDVGGGASTLVDHLLARRGVEVCVVDIAPRALELARARLGVKASSCVRWIEGDAASSLTELPDGWADIWHDRAVFHFLTTQESRLAYAKNVSRILKPNGTAIIAAFAPDGPERCSGLPVCRHDAVSIASELSRAGKAFTITQSLREEHMTPWGSVQAFTYAVLKPTPTDR